MLQVVGDRPHRHHIVGLFVVCYRVFCCCPGELAVQGHIHNLSERVVDFDKLANFRTKTDRRCLLTPEACWYIWRSKARDDCLVNKDIFHSYWSCTKRLLPPEAFVSSTSHCHLQLLVTSRSTLVGDSRRLYFKRSPLSSVTARKALQDSQYLLSGHARVARTLELLIASKCGPWLFFFSLAPGLGRSKQLGPSSEVTFSLV